jgi:ABC-2 type transport system ATP-binding protein
VAKGQIVAFLGPNGAGKTTTMRMLTWFLPPSAGTTNVAGFDVLEQPLEVKNRIGYLPETPPIYPEMETADYLKFVGKLKGLSGADLEKQVDHVCDRRAVADVKNKLLPRTQDSAQDAAAVRGFPWTDQLLAISRNSGSCRIHPLHGIDRGTRTV